MTAYELVHDKLPATLVLDSMVAALLRSRNIAAVVVGADRVAANGDTANKIGTYQIAVVAHHHGVPFYIAAPLTSIDLTISCRLFDFLIYFVEFDDCYALAFSW